MKWISVGERLPEMDARVLTFAPARYFSVSIHILRHLIALDMDWWMGDQNFVVAEGNVTHWMPLPPEVE